MCSLRTRAPRGIYWGPSRSGNMDSRMLTRIVSQDSLWLQVTETQVKPFFGSQNSKPRGRGNVLCHLIQTLKLCRQEASPTVGLTCLHVVFLLSMMFRGHSHRDRSCLLRAPASLSLSLGRVCCSSWPGRDTPRPCSLRWGGPY